MTLAILTAKSLLAGVMAAIRLLCIISVMSAGLIQRYFMRPENVKHKYPMRKHSKELLSFQGNAKICPITHRIYAPYDKKDLKRTVGIPPTINTEGK